MELSLSRADEELRAELRDWLDEHLVGEFRAAGPVGGPADDSAWELRLAWERELAADRWLNLSWPPEYGGRGATVQQELLVQLELAAAGAPYWVGVQGRDLLGPTLLEFGTPDQRSRFLPPITRVEELWGQGFSEPETGSDLASVRTRAEPDGDEWVVSGQKVWTTFGAYADWLYVLCRTNPDAHRHRGLSLLLVPRHQAGVDVRPIRTIAGGSEFCEVFFDAARTSADCVVGEVDGGWRVVMGTLGKERAGTAVVPFQHRFNREMSQLLEAARRRGVSRHPVVRDRLVRAWCELRIMQFNNDRLLASALRSEHPGPESSIAKLFWSTWHRRFGELAMDVTGPAATVAGDGTAFQRSFLESRAETIYGGTAEIQHNVIGERVLGLPKEPA